MLFISVYYLHTFFFFQAEDGIRDADVTGVQTCALPIWLRGLLKLGAQNRAFPANPEKLCHLLRLNMSWYFASLPGFFENPGDPGFPVLKYLSQQASKTFRQCGHFLAQVADQAPPPVTEPVHTGPGVVYECLDARQGAEIAVG